MTIEGGLAIVGALAVIGGILLAAFLWTMNREDRLDEE